MPKQKVIAVVGPTASGKSALGAYLAQKLNGEVISADSRQVYKGMRVISRAEAGHMVGVGDPRRPYSAGRFAKDAAKIHSNILQNDRIPIVVGGTGFYADALLRAALPAVAPDKKLRAALAQKTLKQLLAQLRVLDPASAKRVDPYNKVRLIRAIEIAKALGSVPPRQGEIRYDALWLGLPTPVRYEQALRTGVEERLRRGMLSEAKKLRATLSKRRFAELGFEFDLLADLLNKRISREEFVAAMVRGERRYAKRQMRWFKRNPHIHWVRSKTEALKLAKEFLNS